MEDWPLGLRFQPEEHELVGHHLTKKLRGGMETICVIPELDIYNWEPPELFTRYNELSSIPSDRSECFFFCPRGRDRKRKTPCGFWGETTGKYVVQAPDTGEEIGLRRSFFYHEGRRGNAHRTSLGMYEYHLNSNVSDSEISDPTALVLCHITNRKSEKAKSATASPSTDLSSSSNLNDSQDEGTPEISAQTSPAVIAEPESSNHTTLNHDVPDSSVSVPGQPDTLGMASSFCDDNWLVDGTSDGHYAPYSPNDVIHLNDSQDEGTPEISAQTSPAVIAEPESSNHTMLNHDVPDSSVAVPRQPDTLGMASSFCDDNWLVDGTSDGHQAPYSPNDVIQLSDLWSFN